MKTGCYDHIVRAVRFYDTRQDARLKLAVVISKSNDRWVYCLTSHK